MNVYETKRIDQLEEILINVSYYLFKSDYNRTKKSYNTNDKSLISNIAMKLTKEDRENIAKIYYKSYTSNLKYTECEKLYEKTIENYKDKLFVEYFDKEYCIKIDNNSLLVDAINKLINKFPDRDWKQENIFISKMLDNINQKAIERTIELRKKAKLKENINVKILKIKKKYTKEEILKSDNSFLIMSELKISKEEAEIIAEINYNEQMKGIEFEPYIPD